MAKEKEPELVQGEYVFELRNILTPEGKSSDILCPVFEIGYKGNENVMKKLLDFHRKQVKATITQNVEPEKKKNIVVVEDEFTVKKIFIKDHNAGDKIRLILQVPYKKEIYSAFVTLHRDDCKIFMVEVQKELPLEGGGGESDPGLEF